jgi:glycosyltransferase involved in cell wall biosynthesis
MIFARQAARLLLFIVTYNAEGTLGQVLRRIPPEIFDYDYRILIIDDASVDQTISSALDYKQRHEDLHIEVLLNPENQGYGGNQKIGYQYAIEQGFEIVALLHGDGQYAPEKLPELVQPILNGEAEAVMGTRMAHPFGAVRGGMPLYKFLGNKVLTSFQNLVLGTGLSEFHSGYRVYSVKALREIPFQFNTNDFHFDTEIIIQFLLKGFRIKEIPIPTYYGDEICYVNGMKYAWNVMQTTVTSLLNRLDIFYERKYDLTEPHSLYGLKLGFPSSHTLALEAVPDGATVLDIGCGEGLLAQKLKEKGCVVHGLDRLPLETPSSLDRYTMLDFDRERIPFSLEEYEYILLLDILEHLSNPEKLLDEIRTKVHMKNTVVVISVPNVAFFLVRMRLLLGDFQYGKRGILDLTHRRLFTLNSTKRLLQNCGYEILHLEGIPAPFLKALGNNILGRTLVSLNSFLIKISRGLFSYQIFVKAAPSPTVADLLERSRQASSRLSLQEERVKEQRTAHVELEH